MRRTTWRSLFAATTIAIGCSLLATGCTFVKSKPEAQEVRLAEATEVADCRKLGATTVSVLSKVGMLGRSDPAMARELATLARNEAARKGADTIVIASEIEEGGRTFDLYDCGGDAP